MYKIPTAKNGVYFTKALTEQNYNKGSELLGWLYRSSGLPKAGQFVSFKGMLDYLNSNYPTFIEYLGSLSSTVERGDLVSAMQEAGRATGTAYPRPSLITNAIAKFDSAAVGSIGKVLSDTAVEVGDSLAFGFKSALVLAAIGGIAYLILMNPKILMNIKKAVA